MENGFSETEKQLYALFLCLGLFYVLARAAYQHLAHERFTWYNLFHPIRAITAKERRFIANYIIPYQSLDLAQRKQFLQRFAWFKSKKKFVFRGKVANKEEIIAYVSASAILVTLGLHDFRFERSIARIVVYPTHYFSKIASKHHIGEYNPRLRTLVFSAEDLKEGFRIPNDSINLGIHEIAHALVLEMRRKSSWQARRFNVGLIKLKSIYDSKGFQDGLAKDPIFRPYAQTNFHEFFAILVEHFIENPKRLHEHHPQLYAYVAGMLHGKMTK